MSLNPLILESLSKWKELSQNGLYEEALDHLLAIMQSSSEMLYKKDVKNLDSIRYPLLEETLKEREEPLDMPSFLLGIAQATAQQIIYWRVRHEEEQLASSLSPEEKSVLQCLEKNIHITPTEISEKTGIGKITLIPILRKLTAHELVYLDAGGGHHWYQLSTLGERILKLIVDK